MRRRDLLIVFLAAGAGVFRSGVRLKAAELPRVGVLAAGIAELFEAFFAGMSDLGYVEGHNITYERRSSTGRPEPIPQLAAELVRAKVDLIVTAGPLPVRAAMEATSTIPIVFAALGDAIATGAVKNLAHPDRNATGFSFLNTEIGAKRVELLREMLPDTRRVAILFDRNSGASSLEITVKSARALGLEQPVFEVAGPGEFEAAFAAAAVAQAQAINVLASPFFNANRGRLIDLAAQHRFPAMYESAEYVRDGGLMSYGPSFIDLFRRAANYVDKILKGAKPADLPVEQPTRFELVINVKTAKTLGLTVPPSLLARADEVIE
jgi:putative ABC transport system substrate-binding protein